MLKRLILFVTAFAFIFSAQLSAQGMRMSPAERANQLKEQLKLNPTQTKKVEEIFTKSQDQMTKLFESGDFRNEETRTKMQKMREETNDQIMKVLTAKQKEEYKKFLEEQRKRMEQFRQNRGNQ